MDFKDYYQILGLEPDADDKAIKAAYRKLARKYHPDVSQDDDAEQKFKDVSEAYHVLKDAEKRAEYDQLRRYGNGSGDFTPPPGWSPGEGSAFYSTNYSGFDEQPDFSDFFDSLFGNRGAASQTGPRRGGNVESELALFLEDTVADSVRQIHLRVPQYDDHGRRLADKDKTLNVKVPAGTADGERIRLKGQGAPGVNGGPAGDLFLRIRLAPHPLFDVDGRDLIITVPVAPWEAALGARVRIPTLTGHISLTLPAGSQTGKRLRIKGKGLTGKNGGGDLYAVLKIVMPDSITDEQKALWQSLASSSTFDARANWEH